MGRGEIFCTVAAAMLAACWTSEPPQAPAPSPLPAHPARRTVASAEPVRDTEPVRDATARRSATAFADQLRSAGPTELPTHVHGPVVVLDLGNGSVATLCAGAAVQAAHDWGVRLSDRNRPPAACRPALLVTGRSGVACTQHNIGAVFELEFADAEQPSLIAVVEGTIPSPPPYSIRDLLDQLRAKVATASCP